ncbi:hypothetical protein [Cohnella panacarvi]|uniref:hypothetical protein n=1 Tax=Cohnella panacarvi TaxID=400776 RepID=UPI00047C68CB|nr:hypothetical protein [Cohnella panacarvi]
MIPLRYIDQKYGFILRIPDWWKPYVIVRKWGESGDPAYNVQFLFTYKGAVYTDIFTVSVYRMTLRQWRRQGYDESPLVLVASRNGRLFAYSTPSEPPALFFDEHAEDGFNPKYRRPLNLLRRMINDEVPEMAKAIQFMKDKPRRKLARMD